MDFEEYERAREGYAAYIEHVCDLERIEWYSAPVLPRLCLRVYELFGE